MRNATLAVLCSLPLLLGVAALAGTPLDERYFLIRGRDYREVDRATFEAQRHSCSAVSERAFPQARLIVHHCASKNVALSTVSGQR